MFIQSIAILRIRSDSMSRSRKVRFDNESMSPTRASIYLDDLALPLLSIDAQFDGRFFFQLDVYFGSSAPPLLGERVQCLYENVAEPTSAMSNVLGLR
jgi:hypothetical protein